MTNTSSRVDTLNKLKAGHEEFCSVCFALMGFSKLRNINDPVRFKNDAAYIEGLGQVCSHCNNKEKKSALSEIRSQ